MLRDVIYSAKLASKFSDNACEVYIHNRRDSALNDDFTHSIESIVTTQSAHQYRTRTPTYRPIKTRKVYLPILPNPHSRTDPTQPISNSLPRYHLIPMQSYTLASRGRLQTRGLCETHDARLGQSYAITALRLSVSPTPRSRLQLRARPTLAQC
jgi:hypothetical protein